MPNDANGIARPQTRRPAIELTSRGPCPTCGVTDSDLVWRGRFRDEPTRSWLARHRYAGDPIEELGDESFELVRCRACAMLFHARVLSPDGLGRLYGEWIDAAQVQRFEADETRRVTRFELGRQTLKHLLRLHALAGSPSELRVLDFGCGDGRAMELAGALGFEVWGVDRSKSRESLASRGGRRVLASIDALVAAGAARFDAVLLIEVLEHLAEPGPLLRQLAELLRPGGTLVVEVPDARGIDGPPRDFDEFRTVHPLEHVNAFTPSTLERICVSAGLTRVRKIPAHVTSLLADVLRTELSRLLQPPSTSQYFARG